LAKDFCGEGMPEWAVKNESFPKPFNVKLRRDEKGFPLNEDCLKLNFGDFYLSYDVGKNSKRLFSNTDGLRDAFAEKWAKVVEYMKTEKNIIGYEIINEPIGGDPWDNFIEFLWPGT